MKSINFQRISCLALFLLASEIGFAQKHSYLDSLDNFVTKFLKDFDVPALSLAIVHNDSIILTKAYGTKTIGKNEKVDENTLFGIGSISKSFTALAIGILVSEGKIKWDDKVIDHLPYFRLYDNYVTNEFTIRDLLTHRSGLKEVSGGTIWYGSDYGREDAIKRIKYLKPITKFRYKPAYQNIMFVAAGLIVEKVTGMTWDDFIKAKIFKPLGMNYTVSTYSNIINNSNIATPHKEKKLRIIPIPHRNHDNIAPAGSIHSTAKDMAQYMKLLLNQGIMGKDTIVKPYIVGEIFKPQFLYQLYGSPQNEFTSYGLGWWLTPSNGYTIIEHSGGIDGMTADLQMIKEKKFGVIAMLNQESYGFLMSYHILEKFLNDNVFGGVYDEVKKYHDKREDRAKEAEKNLLESRVKNTKPSLELKRYVGTFNDEMYGDIYIKVENNHLKVEFSHTKSLTGKLEHWHFDTFLVKWEDVMIPDGFITFVLDAKGEVSSFNIDQPNLLDVDFTELTIKKKK
jgi:CubicO group peptidase (beta-lactamase class C family)